MRHLRDVLLAQGRQVAKLGQGEKDWAREVSSGIGELGPPLEGARPQEQLQSDIRRTS